MRTHIDRNLVAFRAKLRGLHYSVIDDDRVSARVAGDLITISHTWEPWWDDAAQMDSVKAFVSPGEEDLYRPPRPLTFPEIVERAKDGWTARELSYVAFAPPGTWMFKSVTPSGLSATVYVYGVGSSEPVTWTYHSGEMSDPNSVMSLESLRRLLWMLAELNYARHSAWGASE